MQTFLPYHRFTDSAHVLDSKRLGKQRVETKQILNALLGMSKGWTNHPATKMWRGHEVALCHYGTVMTEHWIERGYNDSMLPWFHGMTEWLLDKGFPQDDPWWIGDPAFHRAHQSNLLRKDPDFYGDMFISVPDDLPYVWPTVLTP